MVERVFLGSGTHLLPALAEWLLDQHADGDVVDCSRHVVVLPTGRARRLLEQRLLEAVGDRRLVPPELTTPSGLLDQFLVPRAPRADALTGQLAWLAAIKGSPPERMQVITGHETEPTRRETITLAVRLHALMRELGAGGCTPAEAMDRSMAAGLPLDDARWQALADLWEDTQAHLESIGCIDADVDRRQALDDRALQMGDIDSVTIVSADPTQLVTRLLHALDERGASVRSIVHGDGDALAGAFDEFGAVNLDAWESRPIDLSSATQVTCDRVDDQVAAVLDHLADCTEAKGAVGNTTIAVPDDDLVPLMERNLQRHGVPIKVTASRSLEDGRIGRLIAILANLLEDEAARHFGDLVRHPDVEQWLIEQGVVHPVATWDELWNRHLPRTLAELREGSKAQQQFKRLLGDLLDLIAPLHGSARPAAQWATLIMDVLGTLVAASDVPLGTSDEVSLRTIRNAMEGQLDLAESGQLEIPATELMRLLLESLRGHRTSPPDGNAMSLVGWLDAHLDDAPSLVITGLNENTIPSAASVDPWLPEPVREVLDLSSQRKRTARDAWLLTAILQSGRQVTLVTARRGKLGDPLAPSRLLLRAEGSALAHQVQWLVNDSRRGPELARWRAVAEVESGFTDRPLPTGEPVIDYLSVTSFKRFLGKAFEFLLERDQRLRITSVETLEALDPMGFGSLMHEVLERWGHEERDRERATENAETIERDLLAILDKYVIDRFGTRPVPGIRLQIAIAAHRLRAFAPVQAARAAQGWKVHLVETDFSPGGHEPPVFPKGNGLPLRGKIDRVDLHDTQGCQALDYKTGSSVEGPDRAHRNRNGWKDLQLPLYRFLLKSIDIHVPSNGLGYILLPPDVMHCGIQTARWTDADVCEAEQVGETIVQIIREGRLIEEVEARLA